MVNVNGNQVTLALGVVAAILVIASLIALLIKELRYKRKHRDEENILNAETDNTSIELPTRGFSLLRAFSRAGRSWASAEPQNVKRNPSKASSMLRSLSRFTRLRSKRSPPTRDLESQITAYQSPSTAQTDEIRSRASISEEVVSPLYKSRDQQWTQVPIHSPRITAQMTPKTSAPTSPTLSVVSPIGPDFQVSGDIATSSTDAWRTNVGFTTAQHYQPFRKVSEAP